MRYLVAVETKEIHRRQWSVEAATESEAGQSAMELARRNAPLVDFIDVISVEEDSNPSHNDTTHGDGYIRRIF